MSLLLAAAAAAFTLQVPALATPAANGNVVETAKAAGQFTILSRALEASGWDSSLKNVETVTVLAPTDEAFQRLPEGTLETLMKPENREQLIALLAYHMIPADAPSSALVGTQGEVPTVNGAPLTVDGTGDSVRINGATVITPDVRASNGVIHAIDTVLTPPASGN
ncbi:MAG: fasciclin domain-containing protein [Thermaurantiacus sp.]